MKLVHDHIRNGTVQIGAHLVHFDMAGMSEELPEEVAIAASSVPGYNVLDIPAAPPAAETDEPVPTPSLSAAIASHPALDNAQETVTSAIRDHMLGT